MIGGAIAEAILERFVETGTYGVITTHYSNIKYFAGSHEGVENGAMMFDVQNIRPLFRLQMGEPGSSFAVEIARKIGLPAQIIDAASRKAGSDHINLEKQLRDIARDRRYWEQKRDRQADEHEHVLALGRLDDLFERGRRAREQGVLVEQIAAGGARERQLREHEHLHAEACVLVHGADDGIRIEHRVCYPDLGSSRCNLDKSVFHVDSSFSLF